MKKNLALLIVSLMAITSLCGCTKMEEYKPVDATQQTTQASSDTTTPTSETTATVSENSTEDVSGNSTKEGENTCEHLWTMTLRGDKDSHIIVCDQCGEELTTEPHIWGKWVQYSNNTMGRVCEQCGEVEEVVISDFDKYGYSPKYKVTNPQILYNVLVVNGEAKDENYNWDNYIKCTASYLRETVNDILNPESYLYGD
jgi:hypothetical protein